MAEKKENMFEAYFEWYLKSLQSVGLVRNYEKEPESLMVLPPFTIHSSVHMIKKPSKIASHDIMKMATYTRDYDVEVHRSLLETLFGVIRKENDVYILHETTPKIKGDAYYDYAYYYLYDSSENNSDYVTVSFDVKPPSRALQFSSALGSSREFPYNQKLMLERHNILVNKVVPTGSPTSLFAKTFVPDRFFFTDGGKPNRKINYKTKTLKEWMLEKGLTKIE
jgi:hypothetical protein